MKTVNKAIILGYVGGDPDLKKTPSGISKVNLSVATSSSWKPQGQDWKSETQWHRAVCWGQRADYVGEEIGKGDLVYIEGKIKTYEYTAEDNTVRITEIHADTFIKIKDRSSQEASKPKASYHQDDIPF